MPTSTNKRPTVNRSKIRQRKHDVIFTTTTSSSASSFSRRHLTYNYNNYTAHQNNYYYSDFTDCANFYYQSGLEMPCTSDTLMTGDNDDVDGGGSGGGGGGVIEVGADQQTNNMLRSSSRDNNNNNSSSSSNNNSMNNHTISNDSRHKSNKRSDRKYANGYEAAKDVDTADLLWQVHGSAHSRNTGPNQTGSGGGGGGGGSDNVKLTAVRRGVINNDDDDDDHHHHADYDSEGGARNGTTGSGGIGDDGIIYDLEGTHGSGRWSSSWWWWKRWNTDKFWAQVVVHVRAWVSLVWRTFCSRYFLANVLYVAYALLVTGADSSPDPDVTERRYLIAGYIHVANALLYVWVWFGEDIPLCHPLQIPEYLNITEAVVYLISSHFYQKVEEEDDLHGKWTYRVHYMELSAATIELFAALGWAATWYLTYPRRPNRGWNLTDPDLWGTFSIVLAGVLYVVYNVNITTAPSTYNTNTLYVFADKLYIINAFSYLLSAMRDTGWPMLPPVRLPLIGKASWYAAEPSYYLPHDEEDTSALINLEGIDGVVAVDDVDDDEDDDVVLGSRLSFDGRRSIDGRRSFDGIRSIDGRRSIGGERIPSFAAIQASILEQLSAPTEQSDVV